MIKLVYYFTVTAFVRSPDRLASFQGRIAFQQGDLLSASQLERAIQNNDAILSAFGPRGPLSRAGQDNVDFRP